MRGNVSNLSLIHIYADLANNGICGLCYNYYDGARSFMGHKAYNTPADLKGAVIHTPGADPYVESISAMGATPYNIAWSEVYNGCLLYTSSLVVRFSLSAARWLQLLP